MKNDPILQQAFNESCRAACTEDEVGRVWLGQFIEFLKIKISTIIIFSMKAHMELANQILGTH